MISSGPIVTVVSTNGIGNFTSSNSNGSARSNNSGVRHPSGTTTATTTTPTAATASTVVVGGGGVLLTVTPHAVSRSNELLSCARTVIKIEQQQQQQQHHHSHNGEHMRTRASESSWWNIDPSQLKLNDSPLDNIEELEVGLALLRAMEGELQELELLVRRRGQTNDPTILITQSVNRLQQDTEELSHLIQGIIPSTARRGGQQHRHWQMIQQWFQSALQGQGKRLQEVLKTRGNVLAEQAQRRKRFQASAVAGIKSATATATTTTGATALSAPTAFLSSQKKQPALDSPLFTMPAPRSNNPRRGTAMGDIVSSAASTAKSPPEALSSNRYERIARETNSASTTYSSIPKTVSSGTHNNGTDSEDAIYGSSTTYRKQNSAPPTTGTVNGNGGGYYGGSAHYPTDAFSSVGYGGGYGGIQSRTNTGMRQRRHVTAIQQDQQLNDTYQQQQQLLMRQQERQTIQRVQEARQAEKSLAELGTLFGKMSSLISQQSEVINKVEDDVEAAFVDVTAGKEEIAILYSIKKGNRALILKVFGLLIFFIVFMRFYRGK